MKKIFSLLLILVVVLFTGCTSTVKNQSGVWITYYELEKMLESGIEQEFIKVINNCKELQIENLYIHTRAFGSTIYKSDYFPTLKSALKYDFDVFDFIIKECKKANLKVHAWVNPYRISSSSDISKLDAKSPVYLWLNDQNAENDSNIGFANGIYLNPASTQVNALIVDSLRELMAKYSIDGIHFDDYFYPTTKTDFDKSSFQGYVENTANPKTLSDWRRSNVNKLIYECSKAIRYANKDIVFSISPTASVKKNYENLYADVTEWVEKGYIDEIIPQLYFGFNYPDENFRFGNLLQEWKTLVAKNKNVDLKIGLGIYKAKPKLSADIKEWTENSDIIARQAEICNNDMQVSGYVLFSYSSLFGDGEEYTKERENLKKLMSGENK